ncbi:MAG: FAD:protein FMN transferase [Planctomycetes bacterium]|nr:FAD:protein FMN transferase [Planctomycetota bacterium]
MRSLIGQSPFVLAAVICMPVVAGCGPAVRSVSITGRTMGTTYSVKISGLPSSVAKKVVKAEIDKRLERVNDQMSTYRSHSELSRFNRRRKTDWFAVSADTATVVTEAIRIGELSGGAFDVTVGPLVNLWSFGPGNRPKTIPADEKIAAARKRTGREKLAVRLKPPALKKTLAGVSVDLSAIAKGFGVDKVAEYLDTLKLRGYMVEIGGEVRCRGTKADGSDWTIGIQSPKQKQHAADRAVTLHNAAMATSGDYRNYFEKDGKRYSHTIDPRTGRPVGHRLVSVSVIAKNCMAADALATAIMVLGPEHGYNFAKKQNLDVFLLISSGGRFVEKSTPGFRKRFVKLK